MAGLGVLELEESRAGLGELLGQPGRGALGGRAGRDRLGGGLLGRGAGLERLAEPSVVLLGGDLEVGQCLGGAPLGGGAFLAGLRGPLGLGLGGLLRRTPCLLRRQRGVLGLGARLQRGQCLGGLLGGDLLGRGACRVRRPCGLGMFLGGAVRRLLRGRRGQGQRVLVDGAALRLLAQPLGLLGRGRRVGRLPLGGGAELVGLGGLGAVLTGRGLGGLTGALGGLGGPLGGGPGLVSGGGVGQLNGGELLGCLLYTSDAADE